MYSQLRLNPARPSFQLNLYDPAAIQMLNSASVLLFPLQGRTTLRAVDKLGY